MKRVLDKKIKQEDEEVQSVKKIVQSIF